MNKDILLLGANAPDMEVLRTRLVRIGYRVVPAKTPEQAHTFLRVAGTRIGAVIVPSEMPVMNLRAALDFLRRLSPAVPLTFLDGLKETFLSSTWTLTYRELRALRETSGLEAAPTAA